MNLQSIKQVRGQLLTIFAIGLKAVNGRFCVGQFLSQNKLPTQRVWVAAIGKAASSMMSGACDFFDLSKHKAQLIEGLVITKQGHSSAIGEPRITIIESDHPIPTQRSLDAGQQLVEFVKQVPENDTLLFLISGGSSALVEVLPENGLANKTKLEQLQALNYLLLSNPWPIAVINQVRQSVSCIKNGKLLNNIKTPHCIQLTLSDVANNDVSIIGSGLLVTGTKAYSDNTIELPDWVKQMQAAASSSLQSPSGKRRHVEHAIIADNAQARNAIEQYAALNDLEIIVNETIEGEIQAVSKMIATTLREGSPGLYVWGGETVVNLPENPGQGGRCQSLALHVAEEIDQHNDIVLLAIGTDGTDGPGDAAGALIDGLTIQRGTQSGLDSRQELSRANAGEYLAETGDLIDTGPTGTNVMDLVIGLKLSIR